MRNIAGLTIAGIEKLEQHLSRTGNRAEIPFSKAVSDLIEVVARQANSPIPEVAVEPWYFAIGVYGTTYPQSVAEHETSDYEEICLCYGEADFLFDTATA